MVGLDHTIYSNANIKCSVNGVIDCLNNYTLECALRSVTCTTGERIPHESTSYEKGSTIT